MSCRQTWWTFGKRQDSTKNCVQVQVLNMLSLKIILAKVTKCKDVIGHILHAAFGT